MFLRAAVAVTLSLPPTPAALAAAAVPGPTPADSGRFVLRALPGAAHRYAVWLPPGHSRTRAWPAILFLHGAGECGDDGIRPTRVGIGPALEAAPARWPFVVVFPQKLRDDEEWEEREGAVLRTLDRAIEEFRIDPDRIALAGISQGGHGAWMLGARHASRWSCLVPVCGYGRPRTLTRRLGDLPVWAFHGALDDVIDPAESRRIVDALRADRAARGGDPETARLTSYPEANHNSWDPAFADSALPGWILSHERAR